MAKVSLPFINVRDLVIYPKMEIALYIGREFTIKSLEHAKKRSDGKVLIITQKMMENNNPKKKTDMFSVGIECQLNRSVKMTDGTMKALIEGLRIVKISRIFEKEGIRYAEGETLRSNEKAKLIEADKEALMQALIRRSPELAFNDEAISDLRNEKNSQRFLGKFMQAMVKSTVSRQRKINENPKLFRKANRMLAKRQKVLEEPKLKKQVSLLHEILHEETLQILRG